MKAIRGVCYRSLANLFGIPVPNEREQERLFRELMVMGSLVVVVFLCAVGLFYVWINPDANPVQAGLIVSPEECALEVCVSLPFESIGDNGQVCIDFPCRLSEAFKDTGSDTSDTGSDTSPGSQVPSGGANPTIITFFIPFNCCIAVIGGAAIVLPLLGLGFWSLRRKIRWLEKKVEVIKNQAKELVQVVRDQHEIITTLRNEIAELKRG